MLSPQIKMFFILAVRHLAQRMGTIHSYATHKNISAPHKPRAGGNQPRTRGRHSTSRDRPRNPSPPFHDFPRGEERKRSEKKKRVSGFCSRQEGSCSCLIPPPRKEPSRSRRSPAPVYPCRSLPRVVSTRDTRASQKGVSSGYDYAYFPRGYLPIHLHSAER